MQHSSWLVYVINLDRSKDRLEKIQLNLKQINLSFQKIPAIDGALCTQDELAFLDQPSYEKLHGKRPVLGELGCFLSHIKTMREFLKSEYHYAVILEDDVNIPSNFQNLINRLIEMSDQWDMVKLSGVHRGTPVKISAIGSGCHLSILLTKCTGSSAYIINRKSAEMYLASILPVQLPFDHEFDKSWKYGLKIRAITPFPIQHDHVTPSVIGTAANRKFKLHQKIPTYLYRLKNEVIRFFYTLYCLAELRFFRFLIKNT